MNSTEALTVTVPLSGGRADPIVCDSDDDNENEKEKPLFCYPDPCNELLRKVDSLFISEIKIRGKQNLGITIQNEVSAITFKSRNDFPINERDMASLKQNQWLTEAVIDLFVGW